mmetsp:Transcript_9005/g.13056  ORF Transcript_9005/g.13056 Transcript_9005/m.13056 type:complete len:919 (+) Transcript_9005:71-2827(+)
MMMAEQSFPSETAALYDAVSKGDEIRIVMTYTKAAIKDLESMSNRCGADGDGGGIGDSSPKTEEKLDDYYFQNQQSSHNNNNNNSGMTGSAPFWLRHYNRSIYSTLAIGPSSNYFSSSGPATPASPIQMENMLKELEHLINECNNAIEEQADGMKLEEKKQAAKFQPQHQEEGPDQDQLRLNLLEDDIRYLTKVLSDARPPVNFVYVGKGNGTVLDANNSNNNNRSGSTIHAATGEGTEHASQQGGERHSQASAANPSGSILFDGSTGGGTGSLIHLACVVDAPFALAILLLFGGEVSGRHTAFRRLPIHEASCSGSINCLTLLLEISRECVATSLQSDCNGDDDMDVVAARAYSGEKKRRAHSKVAKQNSDADDDGKARSSLKQYTRFDAEKHTFYQKVRLILDLAQEIKNGMTELDAARCLLSQMGVPQIVRNTLVSTGPLAAIPDGHGNTALHWAAFKNSRECVSVLLSMDADPNARSQHSGWTPLHDAAYSDAACATALLLEAGANVDARANSGATPLCFAAQEDSPKATKLLLEAGAEASVRCCGGHHSSLNNANPAATAARLPFMPSRFSGYTPLHYCAHYNASRAAKVLVAHGTPIDIEDLSNRRPIHVAAARGSSDVLRELLTAGAKLETHPGSSPPKSRSLPNDSTKQGISWRNMNRRNFSMDGAEDASPGNTGRLAVASSVTQDTIEGTAPVLVPAAPSSRIRNIDQIHPQALSPASVIMLPSTPSAALISPVSSPILKSMIPSKPVQSSKPWNCLTQERIDECYNLLNAAEGSWSPKTHKVFSPKDRRAVLELLTVGKHLEQEGTGIFLDMWPYVLSFCGRGWFEVDDGENVQNNLALELDGSSGSSRGEGHKTRGPEPTISDEESDEAGFTQFRLDSDNEDDNDHSDAYEQARKLTRLNVGTRREP